MDTTTHETRTRLDELQARFAVVHEQIASGGVTEDLVLEEHELRDRLKAADAAHNAAEARAHRAKLDAMAASYLTRRDVIMSEVGELVSRLQISLIDVQELVDAVHQGEQGNAPGSTVEELIGVPGDFPAQILRAIADAAPNTVWHCDWLNGDPTPRPTLKTATTMLIDDPSLRRPPPSFSGAWDMATGRPLDV